MPKFMNLNNFLKMAPEGDGGSGGGGAGGAEDNDQGGSGGGSDDPEGGAGSGADDKAGDKGPKTLEEAQALIKKLNGENAKHRVKNKELEASAKKAQDDIKAIKEKLGIKDESETPEVKISTLSARNEQLEMQLSVMQLQLENGLAGEQGEYFQFLLQKELSALGEDEELSDEGLEAIVQKAKGHGGGGGEKPNKTGVDSKAPNAQQKSGQVTLAQFEQMTIMERSELYGKNPQLYDQLFSQLKQQNKIR